MDARRDAVSDAGSPANPNRGFLILFIVGDSTVHDPQKAGRGWGDVIGKYFDANQIRVENHALGGRSSRTFIRNSRARQGGPRSSLSQRAFINSIERSALI